MRKFKKTLSALLATMMILVMAVPSFAETKETSFIQDAMKIAENDILEGKSNINIRLTTPDPDLNGEIQLNAKTEVQQKKGQTYMEVNMPKLRYGAKTTNLPTVKVLMTKDGKMYIGKDIVKKFLGEILPEEMYAKDYIKVDAKLLDMSEKDLKAYTASMTLDYSKIENAATKLFQSMDFAKLIDLKKTGTEYSLDMNSDEMVDLGYNYVKWVLTDFDQVLSFYKDMGMEDLIKDIPTPTKEERQEALEQMEEMAKTVIPQAKEMLKGSTLKYKADLQDKKSTEDMKLDLRFDLSKILPSKDGKSQAGQLVIAVDSISQAKDKGQYTEPESYYELTKADVEKIKNTVVGITIDTKNDQGYISKVDGTDTVKLKSNLIKGTYTVDKAQLEKILGEKIQSGAQMVPIRDLTKQGYTVKWDNTTKTIIVRKTAGIF